VDVGNSQFVIQVVGTSENYLSLLGFSQRRAVDQFLDGTANVIVRSDMNFSWADNFSQQHLNGCPELNLSEMTQVRQGVKTAHCDLATWPYAHRAGETEKDSEDWVGAEKQKAKE